MANATVRRLQLGNELRHLREAVGCTQEAIARIVEKNQARIAKIEAGTADIDASLLRDLLDHYDVTDPDRREAYLELRRNNHQRGRWEGYRAFYPERQRQLVDLEEASESIREMCYEFIPGLLQDEPYARAMLATAQRDADAAVVENNLRALLARQAILGRKPPVTYAVVMSESCVSRQFGTREVMLAQIDHLIAVSRNRNVQIQILPFTTNAPVIGPLACAFTLLRIPAAGVASPLDFVYVDFVSDCRYSDDKNDVREHDDAWRAFTAAALSPEDTRVFLREKRNEYR
jgi:transcriptional regulator with XRE-family HTH domain